MAPRAYYSPRWRNPLSSESDDESVAQPRSASDEPTAPAPSVLSKRKRNAEQVQELSSATGLFDAGAGRCSVSESASLSREVYRIPLNSTMLVFPGAADSKKGQLVLDTTQLSGSCASWRHCSDLTLHDVTSSYNVGDAFFTPPWDSARKLETYEIDTAVLKAETLTIIILAEPEDATKRDTVETIALVQVGDELQLWSYDEGSSTSLSGVCPLADAVAKYVACVRAAWDRSATSLGGRRGFPALRVNSTVTKHRLSFHVHDIRSALPVATASAAVAAQAV